jgi:hypothetical protein
MRPAMVTRRSERCRQRILHQACGRCPPANHLGDAENRELHKTA